MFTTKTRYGIRAMVHLARRQAKGSLTSSEEIAVQENIPQKFLEAIMTQLRKQGLVSSRRGPNGGFTLARPAAEMTLAELVQALDGPMAVAPCLHDEHTGPCDGCDETLQCILSNVVYDIRVAVLNVLSKTTLHDLAECADTLEQDRNPPMYYI